MAMWIILGYLLLKIIFLNKIIFFYILSIIYGGWPEEPTQWIVTSTWSIQTQLVTLLVGNKYKKGYKALYDTNNYKKIYFNINDW